MLLFPKIMLFGDSLTQYSHDQTGFALAPALQHLYSRKLDIVTRGFSGYNTTQGLVVLREVLKAENAESGAIKLMCIFMGTNDAANTFQGVSVDDYIQNLHQMVNLASSYGIKVILVGPGLHDQGLWTEVRGTTGDADDECFSSNKATRRYADAAKRVAGIEKVPFLDIWDAFQRYGGWSTDDLMCDKADLSELLTDGIHYTPKAYEVFYDALVETIVKHYPDLAPQSLPMTFPDYQDVDYGRVEQSIMEYIRK